MKLDNKTNEVYETIKNNRIVIEGIYANLKSISDSLMKKSDESYYDAKFIDVMDFGITTNAMSVLKNIFIDNILSITSILNIRNIIEYLALRKMYENNKISKDSEKLLTIQCFIDDYYMYINNLKGEEYTNIIDPKKLEDDFNHCKEKYNEMGFSDKFIKYNRLQFLLKKDISFIEIIKENLNEYYEDYQYLSIIIHPHNFLLINNFEIYIKQILIRLISVLLNLYPIKTVTNTNLLSKQILKTFDYYKGHNKNFAYYKLVLQQLALLDKLVKTIKNNKNYKLIAELITNYERMLLDVNTDDLLKLTADCKMKLKTILEMFAVYDKLLIANYNYYNEFQLFNYKILNAIDNVLQSKNSNDKNVLEHCFEIYKNIYPNSIIIYEKFIKIFNNNNLGYFINGEGIVPSYSSVVKDYLDKMFKDTKEPKKGILFKDFFFLEYIESIKMQHGNGYLYFANPGTFNDSKNVLIITDNIFRQFLFRFNVCDIIANDKENESINNLIKNTLVEWDKIINEKIKLFK